jgi:cyclic pyranopterin phosphate synthase
VEPVLRDAYGRPLDNLRISVTRECNYRCIFCHVEGHPTGAPLPPGASRPTMTPDDYRIVALAAWRLGITSFKLTGGEPLLRKDLEEIVSVIREEAPSADISLTTNGYLLQGRAARLRDAGLDRVNVSLHSLRRDVYRRITGVDGLERVISGIREAVDTGFKQIKINVVVLKGMNDSELWDLLEFSRRLGVILQLIELHPVGLGARSFRLYHSPLEAFEEELMKRGARRRFRELHNRPVYELPDGSVVEVVKPYANPIFCLGCRRVRLHDDGTLSPCLNWRGPRVDLLARIRSAGSLEEKVAGAISALEEVNRFRRPFYLWPRNDMGLIALLRQGLHGDSRGLRLSLPKKHPKALRNQ